uniref:Uncharacterized protein n=1 Tax=Siphoviridae sp. ctM6i4 TaxID=2827852 RepID=A0A8S5T3T8_9CAUD|nr:MAG TPA: hypothetical protein [Siphoviridae sp. ctM6i4]
MVALLPIVLCLLYPAYGRFIILRRKTPCFSYGDIRRSKT